MNTLSIYHYFIPLRSAKPSNRLAHYTPFGASLSRVVWRDNLPERLYYYHPHDWRKYALVNKPEKD